MNAFQSKYFIDTWIKYYAMGRDKIYTCKFLNNTVRFYKPNSFVYESVGRNYTNGNCYSVNQNEDDHKYWYL